jgi:hypothetical protein
MPKTGRWSGCLKYGGLGCLGLVALGLVLGAVVVGLALLARARESRFEPVDRAQRVGSTRIDRIGPAETDRGDAPRLPDAPPPPGRGRILLDVSMCRFRIEPGPAGEPIRVQGRYDVEFFELTEDLTRGADDAWTYSLRFGRRGLTSLFAEHEASGNHLRLTVPRDLPFVLEGRIGIGESDLELGGLHLLDVDLGLGVGEHELAFSEPLSAPLARLHLDGSIGETRVLRVGNASPQSFVFSHSIGETTVDLRGAWRNDAEVRYRCGIGACTLKPPREVGLRLENGGVMIGETNLDRLRDWPEPPQGSPVLTLSMTARIGEVRVQR